MSFNHSPKLVTNGLVTCFDAANPKSYPITGSIWYDLSGNFNSASLISGSAFTSSLYGGIVLNGIDGYSRPNISHSYLSSSAIEVIFTSLFNSASKTIVGYRHNVGYSQPSIGSIYLNTNTLQASVITTTQVYRIATFPTPIITNQPYHVILNKDTLNGSLQLFVNGVPGSITAFDATTYAQWPTTGSFIGANILDIGKSSNNMDSQGWLTDYFNGIIYKISVYNRILTPSEVLQNFNATRGRFGI
jgi:hypothetical protein